MFKQLIVVVLGIIAIGLAGCNIKTPEIRGVCWMKRLNSRWRGCGWVPHCRSNQRPFKEVSIVICFSKIPPIKKIILRLSPTYVQ